LKGFYESMKWEFPTENKKVAQKFFSFWYYDKILYICKYYIHNLTIRSCYGKIKID
jgi:hypothetical protein